MMCTSVNTDGSVVYIYEKKGLEDSHVQRLLEVEKRRLLAEIETNDVDTLAMASYFHKIEKNGNVSEEPHQRIITLSDLELHKMVAHLHQEIIRKLWSDVYAKLLPELVTKYKGLVSLKNQKTSKSNLRESGIGLQVSSTKTKPCEYLCTLRRDLKESVKKECGSQSSDCKWVVALCASVDTPLDADTCACLWDFPRRCASLRALEDVDEQVIIMVTCSLFWLGGLKLTMKPRYLSYRLNVADFLGLKELQTHNETSFVLVVS
ncbi:hypothetical protein Bca4012_018165 [Brassica carinata]